MMDQSTVIRRFAEIAGIQIPVRFRFEGPEAGGIVAPGAGGRLQPHSDIVSDEHMEVETVRNSDGSIDVRIMDKKTGETTGTIHHEPPRDGKPAVSTAKDSHGTEMVIEMDVKDNSDGTVTMTVKSSTNGEARSSGTITVDSHGNGELTITDENGDSQSVPLSNGRPAPAGSPSSDPKDTDGRSDDGRGNGGRGEGGSVGSTGGGGMGGVKAT